MNEKADASALIEFVFEDHPIRTRQDAAGEPWFVAADICAPLGITHHRDALAKLDADERGSVEVDTLGGHQSVSAVNESGLYTLILRSRDATTAGTLPHRFRKWVTAEVLPAIRKTGGYMLAAAEETPEELALRAMKVLQATVERQKAQLALAMPKADALDRIAVADGSFTLQEAAKALQIRPKDLIDYLKANSWIYRRNGTDHWLGYQPRTSAGDLEHKVRTILLGDGTEKVRESVRVTPKGLTKLAKLLPVHSAVV